VKARHSRRNNGGYARGLRLIIGKKKKKKKKNPSILLEFPLEDPMYLCEITKLPQTPPNLHEQVDGIKTYGHGLCTPSLLQVEPEKQLQSDTESDFCTQRLTLGHEKTRYVRI